MRFGSRRITVAGIGLFATLALAAPGSAFGASLPGVLSQSVSSAGCIVNSATSPLPANCILTGKGMADMRSVVVSPDGRNLYASGTESDAVAIFDRGPDGTVAQKPGAAGCIVNAPSTDISPCDNTGRALNGGDDGELAISPDGKSLYVASEDSDAVAVFDRAPLTGVLTQKAGPAGCVVNAGSPDISPCDNNGRALDGPAGIAVSPDGKTVYVTVKFNDAVVVFDRDATSGALTQKAGPEGCTVKDTSADQANCDNTARALGEPSGLAIDPDGERVYVSARASAAIAVFDRNTSTGALTQKADEDGCVVNGPSADVLTCDNAGRALNAPMSLMLTPDGRNLYVASSVSNAITVFDIGAASGVATQKAGAAGCLVNAASADVATCDHTARALGGAFGVTVSPDGENVYAAAATSDAVTTFDRSTANGTLIQKPGPPGCLVNGPSTDVATCVNNGRALDGADTVAMSPDGTSAYVVGQGGGLAVLRRDLVPVCSSASGTASHNQTTRIEVECSDPNGRAAPTAIVIPPVHGTATVSQGGLLYTPAAGFSGFDSLTFKAQTSFPTSTETDPENLSLTVLPGQAPVCAPQARTVGQDTSTTLALVCAAGG